mmetsp:Transcript_4217/g.11656  ORF Transcript_4217/g.11656 Transcript_4217/m.11656 type:complete len:444 (-) Transcript_4217:906-2237(-)
MALESRERRLPMWTLWPRTTHLTPLPVSAVKSSTGASGRKRPSPMPCSAALAKMPLARGCSLPCSAHAAKNRTFSSVACRISLTPRPQSSSSSPTSVCTSSSPLPLLVRRRCRIPVNALGERTKDGWRLLLKETLRPMAELWPSYSSPPRATRSTGSSVPVVTRRTQGSPLPQLLAPPVASLPAPQQPPAPPSTFSSNMFAHLALSSSTSSTVGLPTVSVPVLSNTTQSTLVAASSASPPLMSIPHRAPTPLPTMTAVGVARPRAHGQAMTSTEMEKRRGRVQSLNPSWAYGQVTLTSSIAPELSRAAHTTKVRADMHRTAGTNLAAMRSATSWMGALEAWALSTSRMIFANVESSPMTVTAKRIDPSRLMVPPMTSSPSCLCAGTDSPVSIDSSTEDDPDRTVPSDGTFSPGRTIRTSPRWRRERGTVRSGTTGIVFPVFQS